MGTSTSAQFAILSLFKPFPSKINDEVDLLSFPDIRLFQVAIRLLLSSKRRLTNL